MRVLPFLFVSLLFFVTCQNKPTEPKPDDDTFVFPPDTSAPGSRNYVWREDTLRDADPFTITRIWGSSANDVWAVARASSAQDGIWHYDGIRWSKSDEYYSGGFYSIYGFSADNIWAGDAYGKIWHYTGTKWYIYEMLSIAGYDNVCIVDVWGGAANDVYALGAAEKYSNGEYLGVIYHFDGNNWERLKIPETKTTFKTIRKINNGNYIVVTYNHEGGWLERAYIFDGVSQLTEIAADERDISLHNLKENAYIVIKGIIYKSYKNKLTKWRDFAVDGYINGIFGWSENNFFGLSEEGILHYNGTDIKLMYKTDLWPYQSFATEKDVYVKVENPNTGLQIIIRGTLKE